MKKQTARWFSARFRITIGLLCILTSVMFIASAVGIFPDYRSAKREGRARLAEAIAVTSSVFVSRTDYRGLEVALTGIVEHNADMDTAAIRREDGRLVAQVGEHTRTWKPLENVRSTDQQVVVPIHDANGKWGTIEIQFRRL